MSVGRKIAVQLFAASGKIPPRFRMIFQRQQPEVGVGVENCEKHVLPVGGPIERRDDSRPNARFANRLFQERRFFRASSARALYEELGNPAMLRAPKQDATSIERPDRTCA